MFIFNGVFTCEVREGGGGGVRLMSPPKSANATCRSRLSLRIFLWFFLRVFFNGEKFQPASSDFFLEILFL